MSWKSETTNAEPKRAGPKSLWPFGARVPAPSSGQAATGGGALTLWGWLPGGGLVAALAALAGASCCVLPILLSALGIGGVWIAWLTPLVAVQPYILGMAVALLVAGWVVAIGRGARQRAVLTLSLATLLLGASLAVQVFESDLTRLALQFVGRG